MNTWRMLPSQALPLVRHHPCLSKSERGFQLLKETQNTCHTSAQHTSLPIPGFLFVLCCCFFFFKLTALGLVLPISTRRGGGQVWVIC